MTPNELATELRKVRVRYDALDRGQTAPLRRCRTAGDVGLESMFWRVAGPLADAANLAHVVLLFPLAAHRTDVRFSFGRFLRGRLPDTDGAKLRFRRLLDSRDRDELDHRLRAMLRLTCADGASIDWGQLGRDILWFFAESDNVRRRWAQDFYAPLGARSLNTASSIDSPEKP
jgi:CRISPR type I-E-associated protein CasB/Cse2